MAASQPEPLTYATDWLREYASTRGRTDATFEYSADDLNSSGFTLLDVFHLFRHGNVTYVDKIEGPGGLWVVEGFDADDRLTCAVVLVFYGSSIVRLHSIELNEEGSRHDAA
jgi:hypothetical protein